MKPITADEIDVMFRSHVPNSAQREAMNTVRNKAKELALHLATVCPPGTEQAQAIAALESAVFWGNAGISRAGKYTPVQAGVQLGIVSRPLRAIANGLLGDLPVAYDELSSIADLAEALEQELLLARDSYEAARVLLTTKTE